MIATTLSFVLSSFVSMYVFDFKMGPLFVIGAIVVLSGIEVLILGSQMYILGFPTVSRVRSFFLGRAFSLL